jgi:hypothetical protein
MEIQQSAQPFKSWMRQIQKIQIKTIILICIIVWTPFLTIATLQVQYSCHPMIVWTVKIPASCNQEIVKNIYKKEYQQVQKALVVYKQNQQPHNLRNNFRKIQISLMESFGF